MDPKNSELLQQTRFLIEASRKLLAEHSRIIEQTLARIHATQDLLSRKPEPHVPFAELWRDKS